VKAPVISFALVAACALHAGTPKLPGIGARMQACVAADEISGAVTLVATREGVVHLEATGLADIAAKRPMRPDTLFWIASMTKPITAAAVLMLQDEGKLSLDDPVAKFIPGFAGLRTPSGKPANLTLRLLLSHTSGMGEADQAKALAARTLSDFIPLFLASPMLAEPGARWRYCQSGINTAARIVEIVGGKSLSDFYQQRIFGPLGMKDTTFYPTSEQLARLARPYERDKYTGRLRPAPTGEIDGRQISSHDRPALGNGGLFSTASDYGRFCQMLLNGGTLDGRRYLKPETVKLMDTVQTGGLPAGFIPGSAWGVGVGIVRKPQGAAAMLSPGTFGHGGADGTQAWIDPVKGALYVLMVQRTNFSISVHDGDDSHVRRDFQQAAVDALANKVRPE
jgi:CubicO group peptidase (beta-lactamase class C family)